MKDRGLKVRGLTWIFDQVTCRQIRPTSVTGWGITYNIAFLFQAPWVHVEATVYGARDGTLPGWACTSKDIHNIFKNSRLMKSGCVHEVKMLGRQDFFKPEATQQIRQLPTLMIVLLYFYIDAQTVPSEFSVSLRFPFSAHICSWLTQGQSQGWWLKSAPFGESYDRHSRDETSDLARTMILESRDFSAYSSQTGG